MNHIKMLLILLFVGFYPITGNASDSSEKQAKIQRISSAIARDDAAELRRLCRTFS